MDLYSRLMRLKGRVETGKKSSGIQNGECLMYDLRDKLIKQFKANREYRDAYAESDLNTRLASQIRTVREQRGLTQKLLAKQLGMQQAGIARIENVNYGRWNIKTLRNVANALDCRVKVSLETFGSLVEEKCAFSMEGLKRAAFHEDPVFRDNPSGSSLAAPDLSDLEGPIQRLQKQVTLWSHDRNADLEQLKDWLQGFYLPSVGYEEEPYVWLLRASPDDTVRMRVAHRIRVALDEKTWDITNSAFDANKLLLNLFFLAAGLKVPEILASPLRDVVERQRRNGLTLNVGIRQALRAALLANDHEALRPEWDQYLQDNAHPVLPGDRMTGFRGYCYLPVSPDVPRIVEAVARIGNSLGSNPDQELVLDRAVAMAAIFSEFPLSGFARDVIAHAERTGNGNCMGLTVLAMTKSHRHNSQLMDKFSLVGPAVEQFGLKLSPEVLAPAA